ncbi:MAG: hypothetical protein AB7S26_29780 [Sandaracinaceae bacterium]
MRALRRIHVAVAALLFLGACSFIQDWGRYREGGGLDGSVDAGSRDAAALDAALDADIDAGARDAGLDAASVACDECDSGGCAGEAACVFDPSRPCRVCDDRPGEGEACDVSGECRLDLVCEANLCLRPCVTGADCASSLIGTQCGARRGSDRYVCVGAGCDPTGGGCAGEQACEVFYPMSGVAVGTACVSSGTLPVDSPCLPPTPTTSGTCADGLFCRVTGGSGLCTEYCLDGAGCVGTTCEPIFSGASPATYNGSSLGACVATSTECTTDAMCTTGGNDRCFFGRCVTCDPARPTLDCGPGEACVEDGSTNSCVRRFSCSSDAECGIGICAAGACFVDCGSASECMPLFGANVMCVPHVTDSRSVCTTPCPATGVCSDGALCEPIDAEAGTECRSP